MAKSESVRRPTEADLEAAVHSAITSAFPSANIQIRHQVHFSFQMGRAPVELDGGQAWMKEGRADIVLFHEDRPLAVLELKRQGLPLTEADRLQGMSYARLLDPMAPLVVVSNGANTELYSTYDGSKWLPDGDEEKQLAGLINSAFKVASADIRKAAETLLGTDCRVWSEVVKASSAEKIDELSGDLASSEAPFAHDFLIPRNATRELLKELEHSCFVIVEGEPLAGKSSVLRELVDLAAKSDVFVPLYLEDGGRGYLQCVADALRRTVEWPFKAEDARSWLQSLTRGQEMKLVILVDDYRSDSEVSQRDLEDLVSIAQDGGFAVVIAMDDGLTESVIRSRNGRSLSSLGRISKRVTVGPLLDDEFESAVSAARSHSVRLMRGSFRSDDYRRPWIFRSVISKTKKGSFGAGLHGPEAPALLGVDFIHYVRENYEDSTLRHHFHELAIVTLDDYLRSGRSDSMETDATTTFLLRSEALKGLSVESREYLVGCGALKPRMFGDAHIFRIGFCEILVSELATVIAERLNNLLKSGAESPVEWLMSVAEMLPMGEIIAARAIVTTLQSGVDPIPLCTELLAQKPIHGVSSPKTRFAIKTVDLPLNDEDNNVELDDVSSAYYSDNVLPWITLSHVLAAYPLSTEEAGFFLQLHILMEMAKSEVTLRRPGTTAASSELLSQVMNDGTFVPGWNAGIIEPVTYAIFKTFRMQPSLGDAWMTMLGAMESAHLLVRTYTVLIELMRHGGLQGHWAWITSMEVLAPLLRDHPNIPTMSGSSVVVDVIE
ncbi:hypothetical protein ALP33_02489 [Pseudomonas amygdali pv. lachrymans]|uniref:Type I restriction enzyme R protein N-terminal domain-containing protein n=1 Tax=Pseudomonas amygdali pv. lachrymans TaxID=53707 RepID=A0AB37R930_PSEAV|nr:type I restriction enzyme HsdR N-terminal domain-containing protein [Pseudomonas amygdali]RMU19814.1 hypothetical protein ALP33_02489 [Pseudomonas amygdali pv. lachrymans]